MQRPSTRLQQAQPGGSGQAQPHSPFTLPPARTFGGNLHGGAAPFVPCGCASRGTMPQSLPLAGSSQMKIGEENWIIEDCILYGIAV